MDKKIKGLVEDELEKNNTRWFKNTRFTSNI